MLVINYKNNTPQQKYYAVGVKQNNNANKIKFVLKANQDGIDLQNLTPYLKLQNKEHTYLDKIELETIYKSANGIIEITWLMTRKSMEYRYLEAQLVFEDNEEDIVWQTLIVELELNETINADEEISDKNPTILQQLQGEVKDVASMRDVLKNIKYEYDEEHDTSRLTMPRGILPLRIVNNPNGDIYYFDYGTKKIIEENGNNQVGVILIWDSVVYLDFYYDVAWEYHESEHEQYAIDYMGLDGDECNLNTYILYHAQQEKDILKEIKYRYDEYGNLSTIIFPKGIAPITLLINGQSTWIMNYEWESVKTENESVGEIYLVNDHYEIQAISDYVEIREGDLIIDLSYANFIKNGHFLFNFSKMYNINVLNYDDIENEGLIHGAIITFASGDGISKGKIYRIAGDNGIYIEDWGNTNRTQALQTHTLINPYSLGDTLWAHKHFYIPTAFFKEGNHINDFVYEINRGHNGKANYWDYLATMENKSFVAYTSQDGLFNCITPLYVDGTYKHTLKFDEDLTMALVVFNNDPRPALTWQDAEQICQNIGNEYWKAICRNETSLDIDILVLLVSLTATNFVFKGINTETGAYVNETLPYRNFVEDIVEQID